MIVVGVDFSDGSAAAVALARQLGTEGGGEIHVVHVVEGARAGDSLKTRSRAWLSDLAIDPETVEIRHGIPWVELVRAGEDRGATFLVAGTHGRAGFQSVRLGSTATHVALRSRTPVVLVPPPRSLSKRPGMSRPVS
ncbi:MAG TPA: universal stress protein, partial [Longimicrobiales bacterium]|nr:universal stress protein [Longimicrobiales bacterium]